jgi:pimeloyl-ACP methyl ester carboxylesterase
MIEVVSADLRPEIGKIDSPVLVIGTWIGLKDFGVTEDAATEVFHQQYADVPHLQFVMAKQARHFVMWDDPAWFNTQVDGFLAANTHLAFSSK